MWVIGGIAYLALLLFALALVRVASAPDHVDSPADALVDEPDHVPAKSAQAAGGNRS